MVVRRDPRKGAARLTLAARDQDQQVIVWHVVGCVFAHERPNTLEVSGLARGGVEVTQGSPDQRHAAPGILRGQGDGFDASHVARKACHCHPALQAADQRGEAAPDVALGPGMALNHGVGAVTDHRQHSLIAECFECRQIGWWPNQRGRIELPVPGVQHDPGRGADDQGLRLGNGMRHAEKLQVERPNVELTAGCDHVDLHLVQQPRLAQLAPEHGGSERRRVNRAAQVAPQMCHAADVILMRMGDHQADQLVAPLGDEYRVWHHHLDLGVFGTAKANPAIHRQPLAGSPVEIQIHTDLAGPAQWQEREVACYRVHTFRFQKLGHQAAQTAYFLGR